MTGGGDAPQYVASRIQKVLAEDPRTNELGIRADVRGEVVYLRGQVAGQERRRLVAAVVAEAAPGLTVRNEVEVADVLAPDHEENLG